MVKLLHNCFRFRIVNFLIVIVFSIFFAISNTSYLYAQTDNSSHSWISSLPKVVSSTVVDSLESWGCAHSLSLVNVVGRDEKLKICLENGDNLSFGYGLGFPYEAFVKFPGDQKMHVFHGLCSQYDSCLYLPNTDIMITKQYLNAGYYQSLVVYKNFSDKLSSSLNMSNGKIEYWFDNSKPDYIFKNQLDYAWPVGGMGASEDGGWLAIEFIQKGIGLLNLDNFEMKRISTLSFSYGYGMNSHSEFAVSGGGKVIVVMGLNTPSIIFENDGLCGDVVTDLKMSNVLPIEKPCPSVYVNNGIFDSRVFYTAQPKISSDGNNVDLLIETRDLVKKSISIRAAEYVGTKLKYLALGDSYSSGEGEYSDQYYLKGTNEPYEKCHLSSRSYPFMIANFLNYDQNLVKSVACSGAMVRDVVGNGVDYLGQGDRLGSNGLKLDDKQVAEFQKIAEDNLLPGRIKQIGFVKKLLPNLITVGVGGNDIGFADKLKACLGFDTCSWASDSQKREQFAVEIQSLFTKLADVYQKIHEASPTSKIYAVSYPRPVDVFDHCDVLSGLLLNKEERTFIVESVKYINEVIKSSAASAGIGFIDIQESYGNHALCGAENPIALNGLTLGDDIGISGESSWFKFIGSESFHPNPYGHLLSAEQINNSFGDLSLYNYCPSGKTVCPKNTELPQPSSYLIGEDYNNYPLLVLSNFSSQQHDPNNLEFLSIKTPKNTFLPNSDVDIELNSTPIILGSYVATGEGILDLKISIPIDLKEGYHTVLIKGMSYSGESVDFYQIIKYQKNGDVINSISDEDEYIHEANIKSDSNSIIYSRNDNPTLQSDLVDSFANDYAELNLDSNTQTLSSINLIEDGSINKDILGISESLGGMKNNIELIIVVSVAGIFIVLCVSIKICKK